MKGQTKRRKLKVLRVKHDLTQQEIANVFLYQGFQGKVPSTYPLPRSLTALPLTPCTTTPPLLVALFPLPLLSIIGVLYEPFPT